MIYLRLSPHISQIRFYDKPDGYEKRIPYIAILTITYLDENTAYLTDRFGVFNRESYRDISMLLKSKGINTIIYEHKEKFVIRHV